MLATMAHLENTKTIYIFLFISCKRKCGYCLPKQNEMFGFVSASQNKIFSVFVSASKNSVNCGNKKIKYVYLRKQKLKYFYLQKQIKDFILL